MASTCKKLCPLRDFLLQHDRPSDFVHSVLFASPLPYAIGVSCVCVHTVIMAVYSGLTSAYKEKILIWLTYWSFFTLTARFLVTAFNAWSCVYCQRKYRRRSSNNNNNNNSNNASSPSHTANGGVGGSSRTKRMEECCEMPLLYKVQWVLQNVSSSAAFIVSGLYWVVMYDPNKPESARSINSHLLNSLFVLTDMFLSRAPVRIHHFIYTFCYMTLYITFSLLYWASGGTNHHGDSYIYSLMNYGEHPVRATAVVLMVNFVGTPLMQILLYAFFRLRCWVCELCRQRKETAPAVDDVQVSSSSLGGSSKDGSNKSGEKDISLDGVSESLHDFRGRNYTLTSNKDEGNVMIDVDMDFEMDEVCTRAAAIRPPLQTNTSQVSCTDSTQGLLT
ncbi:hypothetical protein ACOMHN_016777 [Nucella lapillus]